MKNPFFSIIIPCYNVENSILLTLNSIKKIDFKDLEIIFINDGSNDNTLNIIENFNLPFKKIIISQKNKGLGYARNIGIKRSSGKYISLLDADDSWFPNKLSRIYNIIINNKNIDLICHNEFVINSKGDILNKNFYGPHYTFEDLYFKGNCLSPSAVTLKKTIFKEVGYFSQDLNLHGVEDYDMWLRCAQKEIKFYFLNEFLGNYIIHGANMSVEFKFYNKIEKLLYKYSSAFPNTLYYNVRIKIKFTKFYIGKLFTAIKQKKFNYLFDFIKDLINTFFGNKNKYFDQ